MKKGILLVTMGLICACCLALAACAGSGSSSAASSSASASSASATSSASAASASATSESASASTANASASAAASEDVTPELKAFVDEYVAVCDELVAVVDKAKEAGSYDAVDADWKAVSAKLDALNGEAQEWGAKYTSGELSDADMAYYNEVMLPAASKSASAGLEMLDLIEI